MIENPREDVVTMFYVLEVACAEKLPMARLAAIRHQSPGVKAPGCTVDHLKLPTGYSSA